MTNISAYISHFGTIGSHLNEKCNASGKQCGINQKGGKAREVKNKKTKINRNEKKKHTEETKCWRITEREGAENDEHKKYYQRYKIWSDIDFQLCFMSLSIL